MRLCGAYVFDDAVIGDNCSVTSSMVGKSAELKANVTLPVGCVLGKEVSQCGLDLDDRSRLNVQYGLFLYHHCLMLKLFTSND